MKCLECEGRDCLSNNGQTKMDLEPQPCDAGVHACQFFVKPLANGKSGYWKRMCASKDAYTLFECLGLTKKSFTDIGKDSSLRKKKDFPENP